MKYGKDQKSIEEIAITADFLKVIAEENRLKILRLLRRGEQCVCDIWQFLKLPQNLTSHHLKVLKDFGLVLSRQEGLKVFYSIDKKIVKKYLESLNNFLNLYGE
jgi:ArsR family transcriptional regulator